MRQLLLVALISSLATPAFTQSHDLPSPDASTVNAKHPGTAVPLTTGKTELQKEAERVAAYRNAVGLTEQAPVPAATATALRPQSAQAPLAPNGLKPMSLYDTSASDAVHTVIKKDTLYNISKRYGVTVDELKQANQLRGSGIRLGQTLLIPARKQASLATTPNLRTVVETVIAEPDTGTRLAADPVQRRLTVYAVTSGDTLTAIARRTCVAEDVLIRTNELSNPDTLRPGHMLALPDDHCLAQ